MSNDPQVIVVGSGPAGVSAAWPLVRAGVRVLMIDASSDDTSLAPRHSSLKTFRSDPQRWKHRFGDDLSVFASSGDVSPKFATPQARAALAGFGRSIGLTTSDFFAAGSLGRGGLSRIWGALAVPFEDDELVAFPNGGAGLRASYRAVSRRIGISGGPGGDPDAVTHLPSRSLLTRYRSRHDSGGIDLYPAPNAVAKTPRGERGACTECGLCLFGCSEGSIYDSAQEIPALQAFDNFAYRSSHRVLALQTGHGEHVLTVDTGGEQLQIRAPTIVLAAGTLATTDLALRRLRFVNRPVRLLSNPAAAVAFLMPGFVGTQLPHHSFGLGQMFYRQRAQGSAAAGVIYGADTLPLDPIAARLPLARPFALRLAQALAPALLMTTCYVPGALSQNTLFVRDAGDGNKRMTIEGVQSPEAVAALRTALRGLKRSFLRLGAVALPGSTTILQPGADIHYAGTLPMGGTGPHATSAYGELNECSGVFIADGASLPALPAAHPTLTIMANADRIGHEIARRMQAVDDEPSWRGIAV